MTDTALTSRSQIEECRAYLKHCKETIEEMLDQLDDSADPEYFLDLYLEAADQLHKGHYVAMRAIIKSKGGSE